MFSLSGSIWPESSLCFDVYEKDAETGIALDKSGEARGEANFWKLSRKKKIE